MLGKLCKWILGNCCFCSKLVLWDAFSFVITSIWILFCGAVCWPAYVVHLVSDNLGLPGHGVLQISFCFTNFALHLYLTLSNSNNVKVTSEGIGDNSVPCTSFHSKSCHYLCSIYLCNQISLVLLLLLGT
jgi:hypothetical protein